MTNPPIDFPGDFEKVGLHLTDSTRIETDDGGTTLEFEQPANDRQLFFAVPSDKSIVYFWASDSRGLRQTGIAKNIHSLLLLAQWLRDSASSFPEGVSEQTNTKKDI